MKIFWIIVAVWLLGQGRGSSTTSTPAPAAPAMPAIPDDPAENASLSVNPWASGQKGFGAMIPDAGTYAPLSSINAPAGIQSPVPNAVVSSSPLTPDESLFTNQAGQQVVVSSQTTGNILNITQRWINGVSTFWATYRDGSVAQVDQFGNPVIA